MTSLGHHFNPHKTLENKLGLAGSSYELVASLPRVVEYLEGKSAAIEQHEGVLQSVVLEYLKSREDVTIHGETSADSRVRVPTISFTVKGKDSKDVVEKLEKMSKFGFRWGHFYSHSLVQGLLGLGELGVIRVSLVHYNTGESSETWPRQSLFDNERHLLMGLNDSGGSTRFCCSSGRCVEGLNVVGWLVWAISIIFAFGFTLCQSKFIQERSGSCMMRCLMLQLTSAAARSCLDLMSHKREIASL